LVLQAVDRRESQLNEVTRDKDGNERPDYLLTVSIRSYAAESVEPRRREIGATIAFQMQPVVVWFTLSEAHHA
jgi:hypothetical protein